MKNQHLYNIISEAIEVYYQYSSDTLCPLLMLALASHGKLHACPQKDDYIFACINPKEVILYEWVQLDAPLLARVRKAQKNNEDICISGEKEESVKDIFELFYKYDNYAVAQELHRSLGVQYHHSNQEESEKYHQAYATIWFGERLLDLPIEWLNENFMELANSILVKSGLKPDRPRIKVAEVLFALLKYDGYGTVYNPFTGCGFIAALIKAGDELYADGDANPQLNAVSRLILYGMGESSIHFEPYDSTKWRNEMQFDYIVSTYRGYINGQSSIDFFLSKCCTSLNVVGRFAGIASPHDLFDKQSEEFKEVVRRDLLDTIVLLPFGEVAVLINVDKRPEYKGKLRFLNLNKPSVNLEHIEELIYSEVYAEYYNLSDVLSYNDFFRVICGPKIKEWPGVKRVKMSEIVERMERKSYQLDKIEKKKRVLAYIDRKQDYLTGNNIYMEGIKKRPINLLFGPAYLLDTDALIVNKRGNPEPRFYDASQGEAFFQDGYAFKIKDEYAFEIEWIKEQLTRNDIYKQLYPYGRDVLLPDRITEEQILNLQLPRMEVDEDAMIAKENALKSGFKLTKGSMEYAIEQFLSYGGFGITYIASSYDVQTGEKGKVVLKEFFLHDLSVRRKVKVAYKVKRNSVLVVSAQKRFTEEMEMMNLISSLPNSHVAPVLDTIKNEETCTSYYVMPYYDKGSLFEIMNAGQTYPENLIIQKIVIPLCKAVYLTHANHILHLDIKPENIVIDNAGEAMLIDFGIANHYDDEGNITSEPVKQKKTRCTAPELFKGTNVKFGPQPDIYGIAATLFYFVTHCEPKAITYLSDDDVELREELEAADCSDQFIKAILCGLQDSGSSRPSNVEEFLHLFPGCEQIGLATW